MHELFAPLVRGTPAHSKGVETALELRVFRRDVFLDIVLQDELKDFHSLMKAPVATVPVFRAHMLLFVFIAALEIAVHLGPSALERKEEASAGERLLITAIPRQHPLVLLSLGSGTACIRL